MYNLLVDLIIMLILLMMQLEKLGFIALDKNLMCSILLRSGNIWLRIRQEKGGNVSDLIMELSTVARSLTVTVHTMGFTKRRQYQEHHKKMVCHKG